MHNRRQFIRNTSLATLGMGLLSNASFSNGVSRLPGAIGLPRSTPEQQGISSDGISKFIAAANASGIGWHSFMLLRHGHVVAEGWWKPFEPGYRHTLYSLSKSFTSTAVGLLVTEGKLDVEMPVAGFFKDELPADPSAMLQQMKVKHLLTMNTGHAEDTMPKLRASADAWTKTFLAQPVNFEPGTHFLYNTGASYMLGAIVYKLTGETLAAYLAPRLFAPLGITGYDWETSPQGLNTAGYGLRIKTEDIARFGQMYLQKGTWNGKQILPEAWVTAATSYQTKSQEGNGDWSQGYGYQFWRCKPGGYRGDGAYGQYCIVMPEHDAVLAVTSESWNMQESMNIVWQNILPAMEDQKLPENNAAARALKAALGQLVLPVPKGSTTSPTIQQYNNKTFRFSKNDFAVTAITFNFTADGCRCSISTDHGNKQINCGWENWQTNNDSALYAFPVPGRIHVPAKIAGTATWVNDNMLQIDSRFVEAMHGDTIQCQFTDSNLELTFLNSVSAHNKTELEKRRPLIASL